MRKPRNKINAQIRRMFGLAKPKADAAGYEVKDFIEATVLAVTLSKKHRISELTFDEANDVIQALGGDPIRSYGNSKRAENYRKQQAGVKSIETDAHLNLIQDLARVRNMSANGLERMAVRMIGHWPPRTTAEGNKIVEALKAMNKRDGLVAFPKQPSTVEDQPSPSFRRVA
jgi:hypothetical protein